MTTNRYYPGLLLFLIFCFSGCGGSGQNIVTSNSGQSSQTVPVNLAILPQDALSAPGGDRNFRVLATFDDGTVREVADEVQFSSDNDLVTLDEADPGRVRISDNLSGGETARITATFRGLTATATLTLAHHAYVANSGDLSVTVADIGEDGALTFRTAAAPTGPPNPVGLGMSADGRYLYAVSDTVDAVRTFRIEDNGTLTGTGTGNQTDIATGRGPRAVAVDPLGRFVYVVNQNDNDISLYTVSESGTLQAGLPDVSVPASPLDATIDPSGSYLYVTSFETDQVNSFAIGEDGGLTLVGSPVLATDGQGNGGGAGSIEVDPSGQYVYVTNSRRSQVFNFLIQPDGSLTENGPPAPAAQGTFGLAVDPLGRFAYTGEGGLDLISSFAINATGALESLSLFNLAGGEPSALAIDASGSYLYVVNTAVNNVDFFTIGSNGALTPIGDAFSGSRPTDIVLTP